MGESADTSVIIDPSYEFDAPMVYDFSKMQEEENPDSWFDNHEELLNAHPNSHSGLKITDIESREYSSPHMTFSKGLQLKEMVYCVRSESEKKNDGLRSHKPKLSIKSKQNVRTNLDFSKEHSEKETAEIALLKKTRTILSKALLLQTTIPRSPKLATLRRSRRHLHNIESTEDRELQEIQLSKSLIMQQRRAKQVEFEKMKIRQRTCDQQKSIREKNNLNLAKETKHYKEDTKSISQSRKRRERSFSKHSTSKSSINWIGSKKNSSSPRKCQFTSRTCLQAEIVSKENVLNSTVCKVSISKPPVPTSMVTRSVSNLMKNNAAKAIPVSQSSLLRTDNRNKTTSRNQRENVSGYSKHQKLLSAIVSNKKTDKMRRKRSVSTIDNALRVPLKRNCSDKRRRGTLLMQQLQKLNRHSQTKEVPTVNYNWT